MTNTFFISDTHFGHKNAWYKFKRLDGTPMRPFSSTIEMDETMINNWNNKVGDKDRVYLLGDFCMKRIDLWKFKELKGRICWVLGNHDPWKRSDLDERAKNVDYFQGMKNLPGLGWVLTHCPVYEGMFGGRWLCNIHGHLHEKRVTCPGDTRYSERLVDPRYFNVSVECIDYTPIEIEELKQKVPHH